MTDEEIDADEAVESKPASAPLSSAPAMATVASPAGLRFRAPKNITGITFSTGRDFRADSEGVVTVSDLTASERAALASSGFTPLS